MPALGMAQESGVLIRWLVPEGGSVAEGEPLMEVETDKAVVEVPATASGVLARVAYGEGAEVAVGTVLAVLLAPGESSGSVAGSVERVRAPTSSQAAGATGEVPAASGDTSDAPAAAHDAPVAVATVGSRAVRLASPKAKRLARERGLDLAQVVGSGPGGAVRSIDLRAAAGQVPEGAPVDTGPGVRQGAAWLRISVDASGLSEFVERVGRSTMADGAQVGVADVLTRVVAAGLARDPLLASRSYAVFLSVHDAQGDSADLTLRGQQLASMASVAAARLQARSGTAAGHEDPAPQTGGRQLRVEVIDRSAEAFERSPTALGGDAAIRLTLGPSGEAFSVRSGEPGARRTATLQLDYDTAVLDETRAAQLLTYVSRVVGDPFALVVQG